MISTETMQVVQNNDAELVAQSLAGSHDAFRQIVERYQTLICSLAYCGTGSVSQSEDLAQETFVTAWKELAKLREPAKLRAWLCGILRFAIGKHRRRQGREPDHAAEPMEAMAESTAPEPPPSQQAISLEETAILWRSLERIPEIYREPLVLFYREHQSIETVAQQLELSEDTVRQRLSRGRKLLQEQVLAFVEGALARSNPGTAFTLGVLATLPALTLSAKAATVGGAVAKGGATATGTGLIGLLGAILCPLLAFLNLFAVWRVSHRAARSDRERHVYKIYYLGVAVSIVIFFVLCNVLLSHGDSLIKVHPLWFAALITGLILGYVLLMTVLSIWFYRTVKQFRLALPATKAATTPKVPVWEYRSQLELLGLPLIHLRFGGWQTGAQTQIQKPIKAWIAATEGFAFGALFAYGGVAVAPVSIGACAIGLFSYGAMAVGALAVGGFGFGLWAFAGFGFGWDVSAGCAIAWHIASGAQYAIAHQYALGDIAHAAQANTEFVRNLVKANPFFATCWRMVPHFLWLMWLWAIPLIISSAFNWRGIAKQSRLANGAAKSI